MEVVRSIVFQLLVTLYNFSIVDFYTAGQKYTGLVHRDLKPANIMIRPSRSSSASSAPMLSTPSAPAIDSRRGTSAGAVGTEQRKLRTDIEIKDTKRKRAAAAPAAGSNEWDREAYVETVLVDFGHARVINHLIPFKHKYIQSRYYRAPEVTFGGSAGAPME